MIQWVSVREYLHWPSVCGYTTGKLSVSDSTFKEAQMETTTNTTTPATTTEKAPKKQRERRAWTVSLIDGEGNVLRVTAEKRRDGSARSFVRHTTGKGKQKTTARGATQAHATIE